MSGPADKDLDKYSAIRDRAQQKSQTIYPRACRVVAPSLDGGWFKQSGELNLPLFWLLESF